MVDIKSKLHARMCPLPVGTPNLNRRLLPPEFRNISRIAMFVLLFFWSTLLLSTDAVQIGMDHLRILVCCS